MTHPVRITSQSHRDIVSAARWYEKQQPGLGERFFDEVDRAVEAISKRPGSFPDVHRGLHRCQLSSFPYGVFFSMSGGECVIFGVIDLSRDPKVWQDRHR